MSDTNKNKNFTQVFNAFTEPKSETEQQYKLTAQELYVYAHLSIRKTRVGNIPSVLTSVNLLTQMITLQKKPSANKIAIRTALDALQSKGIVSFEVTASNSDLLEVFFLDNAVLVKSGFEQVYGELFDLADNAEQFMILCVVNRWRSYNSGVCTTGVARWMEILGCGKNKVTDTIEEMRAAGKLSVHSGKHKRSFNRYQVGTGVPMEVVEVTEDVLDAVEESMEVTEDVSVDALEVADLEAAQEIIEDVQESFKAPQNEAEYENQPSTQDAVQDVFHALDENQNDSVSDDFDGRQLARHLAENQPVAAKNVLYGEQFTDQYKPIPRAVLDDPYVYANHFKVNPNEDVYAQVERLRRGYEWGGVELHLEMSFAS